MRFWEWRGRALCASLAVLLSIASGAARARTVVSLTFDGGAASQLAARDLLRAHGLPATFYVTSGRVGLPGYMSIEDLLVLQGDGHEIGGHTVSHARLPVIEPDEQRRQVCGDRAFLLDQGLEVRSFSYPFGAVDAQARQVVAECGYTSARGVGGLVAEQSCAGCPVAERQVPTDPFDLLTLEPVRSDTSLERLQAAVRAGQGLGEDGWVILVMEQVCDGCRTTAISPAMLDALLGWLAQGERESTLEVRTVGEVIGGPLAPAVLPPPSPPRPEGPNLLLNSSLEEDANADGIPDCWQYGGWGDSAYGFSLAPDAYEGQAAQRLDISSIDGGDRKLISLQALGSCAPPAQPDKHYEVSAWYKSDAHPRLIAYYRTESGGWVWWAQSPPLAASRSSYRQARWATPAVPPGATALSVGLSLREVGSFTADSFALREVLRPSVTLTAPADRARVWGEVELAAAIDGTPDGPAQVRFLVDGVQVGVSTDPPYRVVWDSSPAAGSEVEIGVRMLDSLGYVWGSVSHRVQVVEPESEGGGGSKCGCAAGSGSGAAWTALLAAAASLARRARRRRSSGGAA